MTLFSIYFLNRLTCGEKLFMKHVKYIYYTLNLKFFFFLMLFVGIIDLFFRKILKRKFIFFSVAYSCFR